MKLSPYVFSLFLLLQFTFTANGAQYIDIPSSYASSIDKMARYVQVSCKTPEEKLLSIQKWMSENLIYDASTSSQQTVPSENAKSLFRTHRGVCAHFAALFYFLANKAGVEVFLVDGAAFNHEGWGPHSWCATVIDGKPFLLDPTWASGGMNLSTGKIVQKLNLDNFLVKPEQYQFNHMPMDPLWQLSEHPLKYQQIEKKIAANDKENPYFNWQDTLSLYRTQDSLAKEESAYLRALKNGTPNAIINRQIQTKKSNLKNDDENRNSDIHNQVHEKSLVILAELSKIAAKIAAKNNDHNNQTTTFSKDLEQLQKLEAEVGNCEKQLQSIQFTKKENQQTLINTKKAFATYRVMIKEYRTSIERLTNIDNFRSVKDKQLHISKEIDRLHVLIQKTDKELLKSETKVSSTLNSLGTEVTDALEKLKEIKTDPQITQKHINDLKSEIESLTPQIESVKKELAEKKGQ